MSKATPSDEPIDEEQLDELVGMAVNELGAAFYAPLIVIGDRLSLYEALTDGGPLLPEELAERTDTVEPYVAEWLAAGAAEGTLEGFRQESRGPRVTMTDLHCEEVTRVVAYHTDRKSIPTVDWLGTMQDGDCSCDYMEIDRS